jgi:protein gp37
MYKRFKWDETIRLEPEVMSGSVLSKFPKGSKVFVGSTIELFGDWIRPEWLKDIFDMVKIFPKLTFIFLTKRPENLIKWSPFPENCWIGVSATNQAQFDQAIITLPQIKSQIKFISVEPLLSYIYSTTRHMERINWLIIGQQTPIRPATMPKIEWIKEIVEAADKAGISVFLKSNLQSVFKKAFDIDKSDGFLLPAWAGNTSGAYRKLRQEFPKVVK